MLLFLAFESETSEMDLDSDCEEERVDKLMQTYLPEYNKFQFSLIVLDTMITSV